MGVDLKHTNIWLTSKFVFYCKLCRSALCRQLFHLWLTDVWADLQQLDWDWRTRRGFLSQQGETPGWVRSYLYDLKVQWVLQQPTLGSRVRFLDRFDENQTLTPLSTLNLIEKRTFPSSSRHRTPQYWNSFLLNRKSVFWSRKNIKERQVESIASDSVACVSPDTVYVCGIFCSCPFSEEEQQKVEARKCFSCSSISLLVAPQLSPTDVVSTLAKVAVIILWLHLVVPSLRHLGIG